MSNIKMFNENQRTMKIKNILFILFITLKFTTIMNAQVHSIANYLQVAGPVSFNGQTFQLAWSSHPAENYYKQEYFIKGDNPEHFKQMIMIDVITGASDLKSIVGAKVRELQQMQAVNPIVNYSLITNEKTGEYILDFLLSANNPDGSVAVVEHNLYRYKKFSSKNVNEGIQLVGISTRSYGDDIDNFLTGLKKSKSQLVNEFASWDLPEVKL
jgi:hypothetical protein